MRDIILEHFSDDVDLDFLSENEDTENIIPHPDSFILQIQEAGYSLAEWKSVMRKIVRKLISMGLEDNIQRTKSKESAGVASRISSTWLSYANAKDPTNSDESEFEPDEEIWAELFFPFENSTCLTFEEVHEMERNFKKQKSKISAQNLKLQSLELAVETLEDSQKNSDPSREILELRMQHEIIMADKAMELAKLQLRIAELGTKFGRPTHISATTTTTQKIILHYFWGNNEWETADEYYLSEQHISSFIGELNLIFAVDEKS